MRQSKNKFKRNPNVLRITKQIHEEIRKILTAQLTKEIIKNRGKIICMFPKSKPNKISVKNQRGYDAIAAVTCQNYSKFS